MKGGCGWNVKRSLLDRASTLHLCQAAAAKAWCAAPQGKLSCKLPITSVLIRPQPRPRPRVPVGPSPRLGPDLVRGRGQRCRTESGVGLGPRRRASTKVRTGTEMDWTWVGLNCLMPVQTWVCFTQRICLTLNVPQAQII